MAKRRKVTRGPDQRPLNKLKFPLGIDVLTAAKDRISFVFDRFPRIYVSFSGGKDSTAMLHLVMAEAIRRQRKVGLLFVDLEAQYKLTIQHVEECFAIYAEHIEPHWVALPLHLRNAVSQYEPHWVCWDPDREADWVRRPPEVAITNPKHYPFFRPAMEFEEFVADFGDVFGAKQLTACFVGIRSDESLNRFRTLRMKKTRFQERSWTTWLGRQVFNAYPIYDWRTEDIWTYFGKSGQPYNRLYDVMHKAGLSIHQQRICQPYGDDQRKGLWLYHLIEPETWGRVVARVNGANFGAQHARDTGNILGVGKIACPPGHSWESFARLLLDTMPPATAEHYENKIAVFLGWWSKKSESVGVNYVNGIPDEANAAEEASRKTPSWRRICKAILRNDYWCKGLSFTQTKSEAYERYSRLMRKRRKEKCRT